MADRKYNVSVSEMTFARLKEHSERTGVPMAELLRRALREVLKAGKAGKG